MHDLYRLSLKACGGLEPMIIIITVNIITIVITGVFIIIVLDDINYYYY